MKILKRKILLALSLPVDFFKRKEGFSYQPYSYFYFLLQFKQSSIRTAIGQLVKSGEIDKISRNNVPYFRLTGVGRARLLSFFPIALGQSRVWDGRWRIIVNVDRKIKEPKLREFGFKRLARGVFITPLPVSTQIKDFLLDKNLLGKVILLETRRFLAPDDEKIAKKHWQLEGLVIKYAIFVKQCRRLLKRINRQKRLENRDKKEVVDLFDAYFLLLSHDPGLPKKLLADDWPGDFARKVFLKIFDRLKMDKGLISFDILYYS